MGQATTALYADFAVPNAVSASSEQTLFPATSAASVTTPNDPFKASAAISTSDWLTFDFGAATPLAAIVIDHINVGSVVLKGKNTDSAWGSPSWSSGTLTVNRDGKDGRRKRFYIPAGAGSPFNYRYLRLESAAGTTTDGSPNLRVGCLLGLKAITAWSTNFGFPYTPIQMQAIDPGERPGGGGQPTALGNRYVEITLPTLRFNDDAMEAVYDAILGQRDKPLVFYRNYSSDAEVYICHVVNRPTGPARRGVNALEIGQIVLREVV